MLTVLDVEITSDRRSRRVPKQLCDSITIVLESFGFREQLSSVDQLKVDIYYPVSDSFILEIKRRFCNRNIQLLKSIQLTFDDDE